MWDDYESEWVDEGKLRARVEAMEARLRARLVELNYLRQCGFCGFEILSYLFYSSSSTIYFYKKRANSFWSQEDAVRCVEAGRGHQCVATTWRKTATISPRFK